MTLLCPQCETRPVQVDPSGRVRSRCKPCHNAARALADHWRRQGMDLLWKPRQRRRAMLFAIRVAA